MMQSTDPVAVGLCRLRGKCPIGHANPTVVTEEGSGDKWVSDIIKFCSRESLYCGLSESSRREDQLCSAWSTSRVTLTLHDCSLRIPKGVDHLTKTPLSLSPT